MKTHVMIADVRLHGTGKPILKKGDEVTLIESTDHPAMSSRIAYEFEEDKGMYYCASLFVPLEKKPEISISNKELEQFVKERVEEKADGVKKQKPQLA